MGSTLQVAVSGMKAFQQSIATTGHNLANINTPSYSRQEAELSSRAPQLAGQLYIGDGVQVANIRRISNDFAELQLRTSMTAAGEANSFLEQVTHTDSLLADASTGVAPALSDFFDALHAANENPGFIANRNTLFRQAETVVNRFTTLERQVQDQLNSLNSETVSVISQINSISKEIARLNTDIILTPAPDLLDQRNNLLNKLANYITVNSVEQGDGSVNVLIGSGQSLVLGGDALQLGTASAKDDPTKTDVTLITDSLEQRITENLSGGELGGLIRYRNEVSDKARNMLGRLAVGLAVSFNEIHQRGMDSNGVVGKNFFNDVNATQSKNDRISSFNENLGTVQANVSIDDITKLRDSNYNFTIGADGSTYTLVRSEDGATVATGIVSATPLDITIDGIGIHFTSGSFIAGDRFLVTPTRNAVNDLKLNVATPSDIALASPIRGVSGSDNSGSAIITQGEVVDITNTSFTTTSGKLSPPIRVEFVTNSSYRLVDDETEAVVVTGPIDYKAGVNNEIFPVPAVVYNSASGLVAAGSLATLDAGDLTLNTTPIAAGVSDGVSTTDATASAIAIATAINATTGTHNVTARAEPNILNLGSLTLGTLSTGEFQVNGSNVIVTNPTADDMVAGINAITTATGVTAKLDASDQVVLTAIDGRNIQLTTTGGVATTNFSNFDLSGAADDEVQRAQVSLHRTDGDIVVGGAAPADPGFSVGTTSPYEPGYRIVISGSPAKGDTFVIEHNTGGVSDNRTGLKLAALQSKTQFEDSTLTFQDLYARLISDVGTIAHSAEVTEEATSKLLEEAQSRRDAASGVNLDEEAANLLAFEQGYQASAQLVSISRNMFDTLISTIGR